MTKKHFIALADVLSEAKPSGPEHALAQWERDVLGVAQFCRSQNPNFNRERWLGYINGENGPSGGTIKKG